MFPGARLCLQDQPQRVDKPFNDLRSFHVLRLGFATTARRENQTAIVNRAHPDPAPEPQTSRSAAFMPLHRTAAHRPIDSLASVRTLKRLESRAPGAAGCALVNNPNKIKLASRCQI